MIGLGYIKPNGEEIDLTNYWGGSVHAEYAKNYIEKLKETNPTEWQKWRKFSYNRGFSPTAPQVEFVLMVLGWIKVGAYSMPQKIISYAYLSDSEEYPFSRSKRKGVIAKYLSEGYADSGFLGTVFLDEMEEPPEFYLR